MRKAGVWAGMVTLVFAAVIFEESLKLDYTGPLGPGPGVFPLWLSGLLIVLSVLYIGISWKDSIDVSQLLPRGKAAISVLKILISMAVFPVVAPFSGFVAAGTLFLFVLLFREYKWHLNLGISLGVSALLFWVFSTLLQVPLPVNAWGW